MENSDIYKERASLAEARTNEAVLNEQKYRLLWQAAASLITANIDKLSPRGGDEEKIISIAKDSDHGVFWSGKTKGWL